jgi:hypothetical protein
MVDAHAHALRAIDARCAHAELGDTPPPATASGGRELPQ